MQNKFPFETSFSCVIKPLVSEEKDKYLALASLLDVANFIPDLDMEKNIDLLPIAFNACVVNRVNKNGDVIDTATAIDIYKNFVNKPINVEHNRKNLIGVILTAGFSEFGTDMPLTEEQAKERKDPFNITLGGVLWRVVNEQLTDLVEESNDQTSENYLKVSASWELGFSDYDLILIKGSGKNLEGSTTVAEENKKDLSKYLRSFGGSGKISENEFVYRKVKTDVVPLGIGLTENPAADVIGVAVDQEKNISISEKTDVTINNKTTMKINTLEDIKDEAMKEIAASEIRDFIQSEVNKASEEYVKLKTEKENGLKNAQVKFDGLAAEHNGLQAQLKTIQAELDAMKQVEVARQKQETFSARMSEFDAEYDLSAEDREVLANDMNEMAEETFAAFKKKMAVLMKEKKKKVAGKELTEKQEKLPDFIKEKILKSSDETVASEVKQVVEDILDSKKAHVEVPNTISASNSSLYEKYKKAFEVDQFVFTK